MLSKTTFESLPNEIFIESFQYLNAPDIFHSFDQVNYRFHSLLRNCSLHLNFHEFKKSKFTEYCQTLLSHPELKQNIISLQLSNKPTYGQIKSFLSLFSLNEFIGLRSLSLIDIQGDSIRQLFPALPFLSNLYQPSWILLEFQYSEVKSVSVRSYVQQITIPNIRISSTSIYDIQSFTSLSIHCCNLSSLYKLFECTPILKYLKIEYFYSDEINELGTKNTMHLKQFIINSCQVRFQVLELLLQHTPNLKIFSICANDSLELIDPNRWQHLIEFYLPSLHIFKFYFNDYSHFLYCNEDLVKYKQFRSDFWHKQHHWYTDYEINYDSVSIYTIPYIPNEYTIINDNCRYNSSDQFDNVNKLSIPTTAIRYYSSYYFKNVKSLKLTTNCIGIAESNLYKQKRTDVRNLNRIVCLSNIKHLEIATRPYMLSSSVLLNLINILPYVSSLTIPEHQLISYLDNHQLCKCLNKKIKTLEISKGSSWDHLYIRSDKIDLFSKTFSNVEYLKCDFETLNDFLVVLSNCSKLLAIKLGNIDKEIHLWIEMNASTSNTYFDFGSIYDKSADDDIETESNI